MRVLAWVPQPFDTTPGQRFRIEQWEPHLRREGIEIQYAPFADPELTALLARPGNTGRKAVGILRALGRRCSEALDRPNFDLVYIFREGALMGPALAERLLSFRRVPFVFDFDDAVWVRYLSPSNSYFSYLRFPGKTAWLCGQARHVLAGNRFLADYAARYNDRVSVVPTTIDTERYRPLPGRPSGVPVVGWTGSFSTEPYLGLVASALKRLRQRISFRLAVVGGGSFALPGIEVEHRTWKPETEVDDLRDMTVGIMPLPDAEWERGKCGLKALQYMALGIPAVVSPVGVNSEIVSHGRNGYLARTEDDWVSSLAALLEDPALANRVGEEGRRTVEEGFSARVQAPRVAGIFRAAVLA